LSERRRRLEAERARLSSELASLRAEHESVSDELARVESEKSEAKRLLDELKSATARLGELTKQLEAKKIDAEAYALLANQVFHDKGVPSLLLKRYLGVIESYARDFLSKFIPELDLKIELVGDKLEISIIDRSRVRPYETYSGGESVLIGFALRLAIGRALAEILGGRRPRFLIIDEGFGPLDEELRMKVADAIGSLTEEFEQIYVISHLPDIGESAIFATRVTVERDESGFSRVRVGT
jgi:DNA repair exonuclease SbcCD ATPase subunit